MTKYTHPPRKKLRKSFQLVEEHATAIEELDEARQKKNAITIIAVGKELWAANAKLARKGDGVFGKWVAERLGMKESTARRYMQVAQVFGEDEERAKLAQSINPSALYKLADPATPSEVFRYALKLVSEGFRLRHRDVVTLLEAHSDPTEWEPQARPWRNAELVGIEGWRLRWKFRDFVEAIQEEHEFARLEKWLADRLSAKGLPVPFDQSFDEPTGDVAIG